MHQPAGLARGLAARKRMFETGYVGLVIVLVGLLAVTLLVAALLDLVLGPVGAVLALVAVALVVLVVAAGATDEGGVHVDVVEDREAEVVGRRVEDDGDARYVGDAAVPTKPHPARGGGAIETRRQRAAHYVWWLRVGLGDDLESRR